MLLSAGVTTGWHLAQVVQQQFSGDICLHLCDTNPRELVPAAALGGPFHRVLPLADPGYQQQILTLLKENHIDVIVPLIDQDLFTWAADAPELAALGGAPPRRCGRRPSCSPIKRPWPHFCRPTACPPRRSSRLNKWSRAAPTSKSARSAAGPSGCARSSAARTTPRQHFTGKMRRRRHRNHRRSFQRPGQAAGVLP